jgi:hypothetical protein
MKKRRKRRRRLRMLAPFLVVALLVSYLLRDGLFPGLGEMFGVSYHATIHGRVVARSNAGPIGAATIRIGRLTANTAADGAFTISHDDFRRRRLQVQVEKEGYQTQLVELAIEDERVDLGTIQLLREFYVTGRIVSKDMDAPVPAATVRVERAREDGGPVSVHTAADGTYRVGPVFEGRRFDMVFDHPSYLPVEMKDLMVRREADNRPRNLALAVGAVLSGETRTQSGEPLSKVHVVVYRTAPDGSLGDVEKAGLSGWDATFLIQGVSPGVKVITGESPDGSQVAYKLDVTVPEAGEITKLKLIFRAK